MRRYSSIVLLLMVAGNPLLAANMPSGPNPDAVPISAQPACASEYELCTQKAGEHCHSEVSDLPDKKRAAAYVRCVTQYQGACRDMHCSGKAAE